MSLNRSVRRMLGVLALAFAAQGTWATPTIPKDDALILERLPTRPADLAMRELRQLRGQLADEPGNLRLAAHVARRYIEQGRAEADPRYYGYAEAVLTPWLQSKQPPLEILILRATLKQARHDFSGALSDLADALSQAPNNTQAWLTQASLQTVQADYEAARNSCIKLSRYASQLIAAACAGQVGSLTGQAMKSYQLLRHILETHTDSSAEEQVWVRTLLAEIAVRSGQPHEAEQHFRQALSLAVRDSYLLGAYADFLLDQGRPDEVIVLLKDEIRADGLLLRLTLAEKALAAATLIEHITALQARFTASRMRGDTVHRREEARFALYLLNQPQQALRLAQENWAVQREPADARILLEAALVAHDPDAAQSVIIWLEKNYLEDLHLAKLSKQLKDLSL